MLLHGNGPFVPNPSKQSNKTRGKQTTIHQNQALKQTYIEKCESIKEIVRKEDESDVSEEMIFGRLTKLRLESLGRLVRFYSGDGTLQFSCLEEEKRRESEGKIGNFIHALACYLHLYL